MHALWGAGQMQFCKCIVVLDADVDVHDYAQVAWRVFNNVDWKRDVTLVDGPLDVLDHSAPQPFWGAKIGIDATRKSPAEGHDREWPPDVEMSEEVKARIDAMWPGLKLGPWLGSGPVPGPGGGAAGAAPSAGAVGEGARGAGRATPDLASPPES
jgi:4-hydroxy-3-polyprenylbenzoate decarboxylase